MDIFIFKNGRKHGPFSDGDVHAFLKSGRLSPADLAWWPGCARWTPLSQLPKSGSSSAGVSPAIPPPLPGAFSDAEILRIAEKQKAIIWVVLASLLAVFIRPALIVTGILSAVFMYQLARAVRKSGWAFAMGALIPLVGTVALLVVNSEATAALRSRGIRVGLMGANRDDLDRLRTHPADTTV
jgi:hypothetical protein